MPQRLPRVVIWSLGITTKHCTMSAPRIRVYPPCDFSCRHRAFSSILPLCRRERPQHRYPLLEYCHRPTTFRRQKTNKAGYLYMIRVPSCYGVFMLNYVRTKPRLRDAVGKTRRVTTFECVHESESSGYLETSALTFPSIDASRSS